MVEPNVQLAGGDAQGTTNSVIPSPLIPEGPESVIYQSASATMIKIWPLPVKDNLNEIVPVIVSITGTKIFLEMGNSIQTYTRH